MSKKSILWAFLLAAGGVTTARAQQPVSAATPDTVSVQMMNEAEEETPPEIEAKDLLARDVYRAIMDDVHRQYKAITMPNVQCVLDEYLAKEIQRQEKLFGEGMASKPDALKLVDSLMPGINFREEARYYRQKDAFAKKTPEERARIEWLNGGIMQAAQKDFANIYASSRNNMSRDLDAMRAKMAKDSVLVADPQQVVYAAAMGIDVLQSPFSFTEEWGTWPEDLTKKTLQTSMNIMRVASTDAQVIRTSSSPWRVVVPETLYTEYEHPYGLTNEEDLTYTNLHESYHAGDNFFLKLWEDASGRYENIAAAARAESYADVAAIGEMLTMGHRPELIDNIIIWRAISSSLDINHFTVPVMKAFKDKLVEMGNGDLNAGIEALKCMEKDARDELYGELAINHALDGQQMNAYMIYRGLPLEKQEQTRIVAASRGLAPLVDLIGLYDEVKQYTKGYCQEKSSDALPQNYDAMLEIKNRAFKDHGVILPQTICKAYAALQNETRAMATAKGNDQAAYDRMRRLESDFVLYTAFTDFYAENKARGVDLFQLQKEGRIPGMQTEALNSIMAKSGSHMNPGRN